MHSTSLVAGPKQTVLITSRGKATILGKEMAKDNVMAADWHMPTSFNPQLYAVAIGKMRFSLNLIRDSKVFVVNFMPAKLKDKILLCGSCSGAHIDKFKESGLTKEEAEKVDCPKIKEALAYLECEVVKEIETGDHFIFVGKIQNSIIKNKGKRLYHVTGKEFLEL